MAEVAAPELQACGHQVGGHMKTGVDAATYVDGSGKFYKVLQDRIRGGREIAVYEAVWSVGNPDAKDVDLEGMDPEHLRGLQAFIPKYYGDIEKDGKLMIVMDDMCHGYKKPSVCDLKMGLSTVYPWASDAYKAKAGPKDAVTTQVTLGFRMCGFQAYQVPGGEYLKRGRDFGKQLKEDTMPAALAEFGGNGVLTPKDIYPLVLAEVRRLEQWFESQRSLCFYAASVIIVYEGSAETLADANVMIKWVDFAHSFPSKGEPDNNVLPGLKKLISILEGLTA